jgi:enoyl-CoA hydratase/carnithine racemase
MSYTQEDCKTINEIVFAHIIVTENDKLFTITLNRPEKKNAMNPVLFKELAFALTYAKYNNNIWAVVIDAKGDVFCAGADLKAFKNIEEKTISTVPKPNGEIILGDVFAQLYKPCIAKVHASVYAGGFLITCGCSHVVAVDTATFSLPEVKRGIWPFQVMQSMMQIMSPRAVLDFCMRAKTADVDECLKLGLVSEITTLENLDTSVDKLVAELFQNSPTAIRMGLKAFNELKEIAKGDAHAFLKDALNKVIETEDATEGIAAFSEKRKPVWKGN